MSTIEDVAAETGVAVEVVLDRCREIGIVASAAGSGLSRAEHERLRIELGAPADLPPVVAGSQQRDPEAEAADNASLRARHEALLAKNRTRSAPTRQIVRYVVYGCLLIAIAVTVVVVRSQGEDTIEEPALVRFGDEDEGSCVDLGSGVTQVVLVDCALPHDAELYEVDVVGGDADDPFPGSDAMRATAEERCSDRFSDYVGRPYGESDLDVVFLVPTPVTWELGDRSVLCLVEDPAGPLVGSVAGSDR